MVAVRTQKLIRKSEYFDTNQSLYANVFLSVGFMETDKPASNLRFETIAGVQKLGLAPKSKGANRNGVAIQNYE